MTVSVSRKTLCVSYAIIAFVAFFGTWIHGLKYIQMKLGFWGFWREYYAQTFINPAGRANLVDLYLFGFTVFIGMVMEARRLKMKFIWFYPLLFLGIGISTFVPVFLILRERALAAQGGGTIGGTMTRFDVIGLIGAFVGLVVLVVALLNMTWQWWT